MNKLNNLIYALIILLTGAFVLSIPVSLILAVNEPYVVVDKKTTFSDGRVLYLAKQVGCVNHFATCMRSPRDERKWVTDSANRYNIGDTLSNDIKNEE